MSEFAFVVWKIIWTQYHEATVLSIFISNYRARIDSRIKQLTDVLVNELQASPERSLRGGPRAARRAVTQLIRLGKSAQVSRVTQRFRIKQLKSS